MRKTVLILAILALVIAGCGRKEPPQVMADVPAPQIATFKHVVKGNGLFLTIKITDGSHGVGFQVDRSEVDPSCKCPGFWRRFYEEVPSNKLFNKEITKVFRLKRGREYAFRVRGIDALGRFTEWTSHFLAKAEKVNE